MTRREGRRLLTAMVAVAVMLLGAACSDEKKTAGGTGLGSGSDAAGEGTGDGGGDDPCVLLEMSEIEAAFGERGAVAEGEALGFSCTWDVGDVGGDGGILGLTSTRAVGSVEQGLTEVLGHLDGQPVEVDGVGDEAYFTATGEGMFRASRIDFRTGPWLVVVDAHFSPEPAGTQDKLVTLAQHVVDRLS